MLKKVGEGIAIAGLGGLVAGKLYVGKKYLDWRRRRAHEKQGVGMDRRQFSKLPRSRQRNVLYYRRQQVRDLENIYRAGYSQRRRRSY